jgi:hypothetical protein
MPDTIGEDNHGLLAHVLLPGTNEVNGANETDRRATATAPAATRLERVPTAHEDGTGEAPPDKTPVAQSEDVVTAYAAVRRTFPDDHAVSAWDVVDATVETDGEAAASAVAYRSRCGGQLSQALPFDPSQQFVGSTSLHVTALPRTGTG